MAKRNLALWADIKASMAQTQTEEAWDEVGNKVDRCQNTNIFVYVFKAFSIFLLLG